MKLFILLICSTLLSGCFTQFLKPAIDECHQYDTQLKVKYCYASKEITALTKATSQSIDDKAISEKDALKVLDIIKQADELLDAGEALILAGDNKGAEAKLNAFKLIIGGLKDG